MILKNCSSCIIHGPDDEVSIRSRVQYMDGNITLHFDGDSDLGPNTDRIRVDFFDSQVGYIKTFCELEVRKNSDPYILEPWLADCKILEVLEILQRQEDLRVRTAKEATFISDSHGSFSGIIQNISVGGLYMTTATKMSVGEHFSFQFNFTKKNQEVEGKILRETQIRDNYFGYGCQFVRLPKSIEREIRQYVYRKQLSNAW